MYKYRLKNNLEKELKIIINDITYISNYINDNDKKRFFFDLVKREIKIKRILNKINNKNIYF